MGWAEGLLLRETPATAGGVAAFPRVQAAVGENWMLEGEK